MEEVANAAAVLITGFADGPVVELVLIVEVGVELVAVIFPRDVLLEQRVADVANARRWNGERRVVHVLVGVGIRTITKIAWVVVVQDVVMSRLAARINQRRQFAEVIQN